MAAAQQPSQDSFVALVMVHDPKERASLFYELDLQHLFSGQPSDEDEFPPVLSFPEPVARFRHLCRGEAMAIASSGDLIVAATTQGRTLICNRGNTDASSGPDQQPTKLFQALVPAGDDMFLSMPVCPKAEVDSDLDQTGAQDPCFELLLRLPDGPWAWHLIPDPPGLSGKPDITGFFTFTDAAGANVWVSFKDQGTFSFDAARRRWRMEGAWVLPLAGLSILVSDGIPGGRKLLFGKLRGCEDEYDRLAACDMEARLPAIIKSWSLDEICPSTRPRAWPRGYLKLYNSTELAYLGGGRLCISMLIENTRCTGWSEERPNPHVLTITAVDVEVTPRLQLMKRKFSCYSMPQDSRAAWAL